MPKKICRYKLSDEFKHNKIDIRDINSLNSIIFLRLRHFLINSGFSVLYAKQILSISRLDITLFLMNLHSNIHSEADTEFLFGQEEVLVIQVLQLYTIIQMVCCIRMTKINEYK